MPVELCIWSIFVIKYLSPFKEGILCMAELEHSLYRPNFFRATSGRSTQSEDPGKKQTSKEVSRKVEERHTWDVSEMAPYHLSGVVNLFKDYDRPVETPDGMLERDSLHVHHENLTLYTPRNWKDQEAVSRFESVARKFYFPNGEFEVIAPKTGESVKVERKSWVAMRDGEVVGVYSALNDDPYAPKSDRERAERPLDPEKPNEQPLKMAYGHVMMIKRSVRRTEIGSYLFAKSNDEIFAAGYDQVTACIDQAGNWSANVDFLLSLGFRDDFRKSSAYSYIDGEGNRVIGRREILTADAWKKCRSDVYTRIGKKWNVSPVELAAV